MSFTRETTLHCDGGPIEPNCKQFFRFDGTAGQTREQAGLSFGGWKYWAGEDLCPGCARDKLKAAGRP